MRRFATRGGITPAVLLGIALAAASVNSVAADERNQEYRVTVFPSHPIAGSREWIGIGYLGYVNNTGTETQTGYLGAGTIWKFAGWGEAWAMALATRARVEQGADTDELRPVLGLKSLTRTEGGKTLYNFLRFEYRILDTEGQAQREYVRLRDRVGTEFPFGPRRYAVGAWYGLADVEVFYRFDKDVSDLGRLRAGAGWVVSERLRAEFLYHMQFKPDAAGQGLEWTDNIFRLNLKLAFSEGLLSRLGHAGADGDD